MSRWRSNSSVKDVDTAAPRTAAAHGTAARSGTTPPWVTLARLVRPQGRRGELLADILTDFPESFASRKRLFLEPPAGTSQGQMREAVLEAHWLHKGRVVLKFAGIDSISAADELRGFSVVIAREERMPLAPDTVYVSDLAGAHVFDLRNGEAEDVGEIMDVLPEGIGPAMLVVRTPSSSELLIPFVKAYLKRVDLPLRRVEMELPEGLVSIDAPLTEEERRRMEAETRQ
jgi:16S rRNA processing protein RimM